MGRSTYWPREVRQADRKSAKQGAVRRMDRLRSELAALDPAVADRAWRDVGEVLQKITDRYAR